MTDRYDRSPSSVRAGLSRERLGRLLSVYGANPRRWPEDVRKLRSDDLGMNAELRAQLADEGALDEALDSMQAVEIPDRLRVQLLSQFEYFCEQKNAPIWNRIARLVASLREVVWPGSSWWQPAFALSVSILVGLSAGLAIPDWPSDTGDQQVTSISDTPTSLDIGQGQ